MDPDRGEQLAREARAGKWVGAAAILSALLYALSIFSPIARGIPSEASGDEVVAAIKANAGGLLATAILNAVAIALLAVILLFLYRAARDRLESVPAAAGVLGVVGPLAYAVVLVVNQVLTQSAIASIEAKPGLTVDELTTLVQDRIGDVLPTVRLAALLALGFGFVLVSLFAMRAGLVSRFLGYIGIITGILYVIPLLAGPQIIQIFWVGAIGLIALDRWPNGRGPAWETGEAKPWPSAAEQRQAYERRQAEGGDSPAGDEDGTRPRKRKHRS